MNYQKGYFVLIPQRVLLPQLPIFALGEGACRGQDGAWDLPGGPVQNQGSKQM